MERPRARARQKRPRVHARRRRMRVRMERRPGTCARRARIADGRRRCVVASEARNVCSTSTPSVLRRTVAASPESARQPRCVQGVSRETLRTHGPCTHAPCTHALCIRAPRDVRHPSWRAFHVKRAKRSRTLSPQLPVFAFAHASRTRHKALADTRQRTVSRETVGRSIAVPSAFLTRPSAQIR